VVPAAWGGTSWGGKGVMSLGEVMLQGERNGNDVAGGD